MTDDEKQREREATCRAITWGASTAVCWTMRRAWRGIPSGIISTSCWGFVGFC